MVPVTGQQSTMPSPCLQPVTLTGRFVRLEPLGRAHAAGLLAAADPETFRYMHTVPRTWDVAGFEGYIDTLLASTAMNCFAVCRNDTSGGATPVGVTAYLDIRPEHRGVEIGMTWYSPSVRGTAINPETKRLLLAHAFETDLYPAGPAIRVMLKTDERNARSRAAILKLGATFEGILRNHVVMPDGFLRQTAVYGVIDAEWPGVRARLDARLSG